MSLIDLDSIDVTNTNTPPTHTRRTSSSANRRPNWIKVRAPGHGEYEKVRDLMRSKSLHTVCEEARCPNLGECWGSGTATFLIMGDICTRSCGFCDIATGRPKPLDWQEPERLAQAVKAMNLKHVVITSVNRDERKDGGAPIFALCIERIREIHPGCTIEVLIPDFKGEWDALKIVMDAQPEILNHNVETVPRLFHIVQPQDEYAWALTTLRNAKEMDKEVLTKSGIMVGLGEEWDEVLAVMQDLADIKLDILTIGQYLRPTQSHLPMGRYYTPAEFDELKRIGLDMGFKWVESGPLVRSSYRADQQVAALSPLVRKWQATS